MKPAKLNQRPVYPYHNAWIPDGFKGGIQKEYPRTGCWTDDLYLQRLLSMRSPLHAIKELKWRF